MNKNDIIIRRPKLEEIDSINEFFVMMLKDTFEMNEISNLKETFEEEVINKSRYINKDFETNGEERYFLLAVYNNEIIGSIEYGLSNELLNKCTNYELKDMLEIGTVFVHPAYRKQGLASLLFYNLFQILKSKGVEEICFDSGYKKAQQIWRHKFGEPRYFIQDFWGDGAHHMIWRVKVQNGLKLCK